MGILTCFNARYYQIIIQSKIVSQEFADGPARCGLLTQEETIGIFLYYAATEKPEIKFPTEPRTYEPFR